jgi:hypothetical protein
LIHIRVGLALVGLACLSAPLALAQGEANGPPDLARRSAAELKKTLLEINAVPKHKMDAVTAEREAALRLLKSYRYLVGVPYENVVLDDELNKYADAAARICRKIGRIDHHPKNPGLPDDEYQIALKGTTSCNLFQTGGPENRVLLASVETFVADAGPNIEHLGHRRWCLNPLLRKVGFGRAGKFAALSCFDRSQEKVPDFDFVSFPCPGLMPLEYFRPTYAWNVSVNPQKYGPPQDSVKAAIYRADRKGEKDGPPLKLNFHKVDRQGYGLGNAIIFRPDPSVVALGKRYVVEITGLVRADGTAAEALRYPVELILLSRAP